MGSWWQIVWLITGTLSILPHKIGATEMLRELEEHEEWLWLGRE